MYDICTHTLLSLCQMLQYEFVSTHQHCQFPELDFLFKRCREELKDEWTISIGVEFIALHFLSE